MNEKIISVVIPVFNAEKTLDELAHRVGKVFEGLDYQLELMLVDDGSSDGSWQKIEHLYNQYDFVSAIKLTENFGQHTALLSGFTQSNGGLIVTMDDDLQHPPEEIYKLISEYERTKADVVYGISDKKKHSLIHTMGSKLITLSSEHDKLPGSSFRLIKREIIQKIIDNHQYNFLFIDALLNWYTDFFAFVKVDHQPRKSGKSGYNLLKLFRMHFYTVINYSNVPLRFVTTFGMIFSVITFVMGIWFILKKILFNVPMGYTSIIVVILFSTSMILYILGLIGLYVHKIFESNLKKPVYFIRKKLTKRS